jgi:hypothetical protein
MSFIKSQELNRFDLCDLFWIYSMLNGNYAFEISTPYLKFGIR